MPSADSSKRVVPFAVMCPFGPDQQELVRLHDLLDSLWTYEPEVSCVVIVDDLVQERPLLRELKPPAGCRIHRLVNPHTQRATRYPRTRGALCVKTLMGLAWVQANTDARFVLRVDTDALLIAPFADQLAAFFDSHPDVAQTSCHQLDCNGGQRSWADWPRMMRRLLHPLRLRPSTRLGLRIRPEQAIWGPMAEVRRHIRAAVANGYDAGENCMGGAMALSRSWLDRMRQAGYFDDPSIWFHVHVADDVMLGMYARAVGMRLADMGQGNLFGVRWKGLADRPEHLARRGFAIIHSVASDCEFLEPQVRSFFKQQRNALRRRKASATSGTLASESLGA